MKTFYSFCISVLTVFLFFCIASTSMAQNVGISNSGAYNPYDGAILDLDKSGGLLLPRLTTTERDALDATFAPSSGANGMMIYNTDSSRYEVWVNSGGWQWKDILTTDDLTTDYILNQTALQPTSNFNISGNGIIGTAATVGSSLKVGDGIVIGDVLTASPGSGNILMTADDSWIGRGITAPKISFNTATETIAISPIDSAVISVSQGNVAHTALVVKNLGAASGVGIKLSGFRNESTEEVGYIDFENNDGGLATLARVGVKNESSNNTNGSFHIALRSASALTERLALDNGGNLTVTGKFNSQGIQETSDARFKKNISNISNALSTVLNLEGVTYNWRTEEFPERSFGERMEYGVIAQQVEKVVPELVSTDKDGFKSVQYSHMVPLLLEAIKEQQLIINSQSQEIGVLKASVDAISEHIKTAEK
jgi:hypothetical protein